MHPVQRMSNPTRVVGGGPATVMGGGRRGGFTGHPGPFGHRRRRGFYPYPYPYYPYPYGYPAYPAFSSPYWFGGWRYSYPFGYGFGYPGSAAPYAGPYAAPYYATGALAAAA